MVADGEPLEDIAVYLESKLEVFNDVVPTPADDAFPKSTCTVLATYVLAVLTVG